MLDQWILDKPAAMLSALLIIGCDPLRTLQARARGRCTAGSGDLQEGWFQVR